MYFSPNCEILFIPGIQHLKYFIYLLLLFSFQSLNAQCPDHSVTLNSQDDIDEFRQDYPNCRDMLHTIRVEGLGVRNLNGLSNLRSINSLIISGTKNLKYLTGLNKIRKFGSLGISNNEGLVELKALNSLDSIQGHFDLNRNNKLVNLEGLEGIMEIEGHLSITNNENLLNLQGLESVDSIGGVLQIKYNSELESLLGLNELEKIDGALYIIDNPKLTSIQDLKNVHYIDNEIIIRGTDSLTNLTGLNGVDSVRGNLSFYNNTYLKSLEGVNSIVVIDGELNIKENSRLIDLNGLDKLQKIGELFKIQKNINLESMNGVPKLNCIGEGLIIEDNPNLIDMTGFVGLKKTGSIRISRNEILPTLFGLDNIDYTNWSWITVVDCPLLSYCHINSICGYLINGLGEGAFRDNKDGCNSKDQIEELCKTTSTHSSSIEKDIKVYHNPENRSIRIDVDFKTEVKLTISDLAGKIFAQKKILGKDQLHLENLPIGLFVINFKTAFSTRNKKIINLY